MNDTTMTVGNRYHGRTVKTYIIDYTGRRPTESEVIKFALNAANETASSLFDVRVTYYHVGFAFGGKVKVDMHTD